MRVAVIGCGAWGATVARRLRERSDVEVATVRDPDDSRADALADELGCTWRGCHTLANTRGIDAAVIATPPGSGRFDQVAACVAADVTRIRVEKPVALDYEEALGIMAMFGDRAEITVGHTTLAAPAVEFMRGWVASAGATRAEFRRATTGEARHDVSAWWDLASHDIATALHLGLDPAECEFTAQHNWPGAERHLSINIGTTKLRYCESTGTAWEYNGNTIPARATRFPTGDELERDLDAWVNGRGTPLAFGVEVVRHLAKLDPACN